jgi:spore germination protein YaaH
MAAAIQYDLDGINLDFEELSGSVGDAYIQFVRELSLKCKANGIILSVDNYVPSEYTTFYNRSEQAVFADYVIVMAYDEHYAGSDEGSVSSIGFVTSGVENTLKEVPANQIILGLPFYTRVWQETPKDTDGDDVESASDDYVPYTLTSTAVGMNEADTLVTENGAQKEWNDECGQYYAEYTAGGDTFKIWLEEETSLEEKLKVMQANSLAGVSFWKLGLERETAWDVIIKYTSN